MKTFSSLILIFTRASVDVAVAFAIYLWVEDIEVVVYFLLAAWVAVPAYALLKQCFWALSYIYTGRLEENSLFLSTLLKDYNMPTPEHFPYSIEEYYFEVLHSQTTLNHQKAWAKEQLLSLRNMSYTDVVSNMLQRKCGSMALNRLFPHE